MVKFPQFMEDKGVVQAALENTAKFGDVDIEPEEAKIVDVVIAEKVVSTEAIPITTNATATAIESLFFAAIIPSPDTLLDMYLVIVGFSITDTVSQVVCFHFSLSP